MKTNNRSPDILNTSANLFGLCFVVFTSLRALKLSANTYLDECAVSMFPFIVSCASSFLAIGSITKRSIVYESVADYAFMARAVHSFPFYHVHRMQSDGIMARKQVSQPEISDLCRQNKLQ